MIFFWEKHGEGSYLSSGVTRATDIRLWSLAKLRINGFSLILCHKACNTLALTVLPDTSLCYFFFFWFELILGWNVRKQRARRRRRWRWWCTVICESECCCCCSAFLLQQHFPRRQTRKPVEMVVGWISADISLGLLYYWAARVGVVNTRLLEIHGVYLQCLTVSLCERDTGWFMQH